MATDLYRGWQEPISAHLALQDAVKALAVGSDPVRIRLDRATSILMAIAPAQYPEHLRQRAENIRTTRISVRASYITDERFDFGRLTTKQQRQLVDDIISLHEACLLDIGKMEVEYYDIVYPTDTQ